MIIRYAEPIYDDKIKDYQLSGIGKKFFVLSKKGIADIHNFRKTSKLSDKCFTSEANIAILTAKELGYTKCSPIPELNNILHDFKQFNQNTKSMSEVRFNSILYLAQNKTIEKLESVLKRIKQLEKIIKENPEALFISHGYFMKVLKLYLQNNNFYELDNIALKKLVKPNIKFYGSMKGFEF